MASNPRDTDALKKASPPADRGESPPEDIEDFNEFFEQLSDMDDVELSTPPDAALGGLRLAEEDQLESKWNQALLGKPAPFRQTLASPPSKMGQFHSQEPTSESKPAKPPLPVMKPGFGLFTGLKVIFLGGLMFLAGLGAVALVLLPPGAAPPWKSDHSGAVGGGVAEPPHWPLGLDGIFSEGREVTLEPMLAADGTNEPAVPEAGQPPTPSPLSSAGGEAKAPPATLLPPPGGISPGTALVPSDPISMASGIPPAQTNPLGKTASSSLNQTLPRPLAKAGGSSKPVRPNGPVKRAEPEKRTTAAKPSVAGKPGKAGMADPGKASIAGMVALQVGACSSGPCREQFRKMLAPHIPKGTLRIISHKEGGKVVIYKIRVEPLTPLEANRLKSRLAGADNRLKGAYIVPLNGK